MKEKYVTDKMCWKLSTKFLFLNKKITEEQYEHLYDLDKIDFEYQVDPYTIGEINNIIETHPDGVTELIKKDAMFLLNGEISNKLLWISYLIECLSDEQIDREKFEEYKNAINFDILLTEKDYYLINEILNYLRVKTIKNEPSLIGYMRDPSFEVLMAANKTG